MRVSICTRTGLASNTIFQDTLTILSCLLRFDLHVKDSNFLTGEVPTELSRLTKLGTLWLRKYCARLQITTMTRLSRTLCLISAFVVNMSFLDSDLAFAFDIARVS